MSIPLDRREWSVNCCQLSEDIVLSRRPLFDSEPRKGKFILWAVLGFGGKPNPLVFSRVASFAARTAQGLLRPTPLAQGHPRASPGRVQLYVDDPTVSVAGPAESNALAIDLVALWWLSLGIPLAWRKGSWSDNLHRWIGADFVHRAVGHEFVAVVSVPPAFAEELLQMLKPLARGRGCTADAALDVVLGKAGRLAYILPATRPFVAALWGARAGSTSANFERKRREAPPGQHANKRFASAARWLCTLLSPPGPADALLPLETVVAKQRAKIDPDHACIKCDASPWGGGAVLYEEGQPREFLVLQWSATVAEHLHVTIGEPHGQTMWEYLIIYVSLLCWGSRCRHHGVAIMGDNLSALSGTLNLKGKSHLTKITREIAWRKCRLGWRFSTGHLPAERNIVADALSRLSAPAGADKKEFPEKQLRGASQREAPPEHEWWLSDWVVAD